MGISHGGGGRGSCLALWSCVAGDICDGASFARDTFLHGVSPPPHPPTPPTPEPLPVPPRYHNLSPGPLYYELLDSEEFPLLPLAPTVPSPADTHISYPPSPIHNPADDLDEFPNGEWPSNPPSPIPSSSPSDNTLVLQAFIQTADDPVKA